MHVYVGGMGYGVCRRLGIIQAIIARTPPSPASKRAYLMIRRGPFQRWEASVLFGIEAAVEKYSYGRPSNGLVDT